MTQARRSLGSHLAATVLWVAALLHAEPCPAERGSLVPGADASACDSVLRPGPSGCEGLVGASELATDAQAAAVATTPAARLERQVSEFLADYGKPPRAAVRALLDPTDGHIRAMLRAQEASLAAAAYVAARMSELQASERGASAATASLRPAESAALAQLRITVVQEPRDPDAADALAAVRALAALAPGVQARAEIAGDADAAALRAETLRLGAPFDVVPADPQSVATEVLPYVRIDDLRARRSLIVAGRGLDNRRLLRAILDLRNESVQAASATRAAAR